MKRNSETSDTENVPVHNKCTLPPPEDIVVKYIYNGCFVETRRIFRRFLTVSEDNAFCKTVLRSSAAIREERARHLQQNYYIVHPFSAARSAWEFYVIIMSFIMLTFTPFEMTIIPFDANWIAIRRLISGTMLLDFCLNFVCGYHDVKNNKIVLGWRKVVRHYLKTYFLVDILSSIPIIFIVYYIPMPTRVVVGRAMRCMKLLRLVTLLRYLSTYRHRKQYSINKFRLFKVSIVFLIVVLWATSFCYLYALSKSKDQFRGFLRSCFHALCNVFGVSYGYFTGNDELKTIYFVLCFLTFGVIFKMFIYAEILHMVNTNLSVNNKYEHFMNQLHEFIRYKQLPENMKQRILLFYKFKFENNYYKEDDILESLSENLQQDIILQNCQGFIEKVEYFRNLPTNLLLSLVKCMKSEIFISGDQIVKAGTPGNGMYFISSGTAAVFSPDDVEVCHLTDGSHFGEISLLIEEGKRVVTVVAIECCELYFLSRKDFQIAMAPYPELRMEMKAMAEKQILHSLFARRL
ncbi:hypothetical protein PPYR_11895 [Photinus pyralis]|uniref:Cyclic nucleotide-binding domain-containing protein n=1 Tax=Photinus pyralis TaxID=7054 RepID=A0A5N4ACL2_PHOPY|nr:potassium/sodium hyperpolarization-activated cyclic nucleotide-gated channel 1-like [Photinus pyralis]KAB0795056.1 hypothetical protein PPYR_11895 [Photinus pyralis]